MRMTACLLLLGLLLALAPAVPAQQKILIYMDLQQTDHLKAYGIAYWALTKGLQVDWLLNYRGGSFMMDDLQVAASECRVRGVAFSELSAGEAAQVFAEAPFQWHDLMEQVRDGQIDLALQDLTQLRDQTPDSAPARASIPRASSLSPR